MREPSNEEFREFVAGCGGDLFRVARLLCGDWQHAEDLTQAALTRCWTKWSLVASATHPGGYARAVLVRTYLSWVRREAFQPRLAYVAALPDAGHASDETTVDQRRALVAALRALPRRQRAVVVLRYYADLSETETAGVLGCSNGTVKSQAAKGLASLRAAAGAGEHAEKARLT